MGIGWVIFWKSVVLAVWAIGSDRYIAYKKSRADNGIPLRLDPETGIYSVDDRFERWERRVKVALKFVAVIWICWMIVIAWALLA